MYPDLNPPSSADENLSWRRHSVSLLLLTHSFIPGCNLCPPAPLVCQSLLICWANEPELGSVVPTSMSLQNAEDRVLSRLTAERSDRHRYVVPPHPHAPFITDSHAEPVNAWIAAQWQSDIVIPARRIPAVLPLLWLSPGFSAPPLQNSISANNSK